MMKKEKELLVAIASQKGGVGKSVFTVLLASVLHYRKDVRVAVVDCDSPQHSIALMRERDMENVMKNDDLKVNLYRQYERIRKPAYPVIKSDPEKGVEDLRRYMEDFSKPKIVWKIIGNQMAFAYDANNYVMNNACYIMTGDHLDYLLAVLNFPITEVTFV